LSLPAMTKRRTCCQALVSLGKFSPTGALNCVPHWLVLGTETPPASTEPGFTGKVVRTTAIGLEAPNLSPPSKSISDGSRGTSTKFSKTITSPLVRRSEVKPGATPSQSLLLPQI